MSLFSSLALTASAATAALLTASHFRTRALAQQAVQAVPRVGDVQPVQGGSIHYVDHGPKDAQPIVLIHGLSGQLQHFTYAMVDMLADTYRVIALDRPGCGYSHRDGDHLAALPEQARMIGEFLQAQDIRNPVVVGHSLGGAVALAMALERPDTIKALALIAPLTHPADKPADAFKGLQVHSPLMRQFISQTVAVPMAKRTAPDILEQVFYPETYPEDFLSKGGGMLGLRPQAYVTASSDLMASGAGIGPQAARYATSLHTPGGVLYGDGDTILDPAVQGAPMQAFGFEYQVLEGRGHMLPITAPKECCDFVRGIAAAS